MSLLALYYIQIFSYEGLTAKGNTDSSARCTGCSKQDNESIPCRVQPCTGAGNATQWLNTCTMCVESWIWSVVLYKPEVELQACNQSLHPGSRGPGYPQLHSQFEVSLAYKRLFSKTKQNLCMSPTSRTEITCAFCWCHRKMERKSFRVSYWEIQTLKSGPLAPNQWPPW